MGWQSMTKKPEPGPTAATLNDRRQLARSILKTRSCFAACPDDVIDAILLKSQIVRLAKGGVMYRRGDPGDTLVVVLEGRLKVVNVTTEAKEVVLAFLGTGDVIGEMAVFDGHPRSAGVVAMEPVEAVCIYRRDLVQVLKSNPDALMALLTATCRRLRATVALVESFSLQTEARVASALLRLANAHGSAAGRETTIEMKVTQSDLGNHLGLTRETVSRTLSEFKTAGLVKIRGQNIVIVDTEALMELAEGLSDDD